MVISMALLSSYSYHCNLPQYHSWSVGGHVLFTNKQSLPFSCTLCFSVLCHLTYDQVWPMGSIGGDLWQKGEKSGRVFFSALGSDSGSSASLLAFELSWTAPTMDLLPTGQPQLLDSGNTTSSPCAPSPKSGTCFQMLRTCKLLYHPSVGFSAFPLYFADWTLTN